MLPHELLAARKGQSRLGYYVRSACLVPAILGVAFWIAITEPLLKRKAELKALRLEVVRLTAENVKLRSAVAGKLMEEPA